MQNKKEQIIPTQHSITRLRVMMNARSELNHVTVVTENWTFCLSLCTLCVFIIQKHNSLLHFILFISNFFPIFPVLHILEWCNSKQPHQYLRSPICCTISGWYVLWGNNFINEIDLYSCLCMTRNFLKNRH